MVKNETPEGDYDILEGQQCPICTKNELVLMETDRDIPFFGQVALFSMDCKACGYHKGDLEALEEREPSKQTFEVSCEEDLKVRVVKSSFATVKIAHVGSIEPGTAANGYVTNIEGILNRIKREVESIKENSDDADQIKKAKNILKKLMRVLWGQEKVNITIEDPTGNSAIISEKTQTTKLKVKK